MKGSRILGNIQEKENCNRMLPREYITDRLNKQIQWFDGKSLCNQKKYKRFKKVECFFTFSMPLIGIIPLGEDYLINKIVLLFLGAAVAYLQFWNKLETYYELWYKYRTACELLQREKYFFETHTSEYADCKDCFSLLVERTEKIISNTNDQWNHVIQGIPEQISKDNSIIAN